MSNQPYEPSGPGLPHPVAVFAQRLRARLVEVAGCSTTAMPAAEKRAVLVDLAAARAQLEALQLAVLADAEATQACTETGAATAAAWLAVETRATRRDTRADLRLATRLESLPVLAAGLRAGAVNTAQARAIVAGLDQLPIRGEHAATADQLAPAEAHLVDLAATHDAVALRSPR